MAEPKTKPTDASAFDYVANKAPENRRADSQALLDLFIEITGEQPVMWGESIVGFGRYALTNSTGTADWPLAAFSPRKAQMTVYLMPGFPERPEMDGLGKCTTSVACLYFKKLADLDRDKLKALLTWSYRAAKIAHKA